MLMGTMAQAWIEEGLTRGLAEGLTMGQARLLLQLMERRFGDVPEAVRSRVAGATTDELDAWGCALLEAATLDEVMAAGPRR